MVEDLYDLLTGHHLLNVALGRGDRFLLSDEVPRASAAELRGDEEHHNDTENDEQGEGQREPYHNEEYDDNDGAGAEHRRYGLADKLAQGVHVVRVVAHNVAVLMRVEILDRQILHLVEQGLAHLVQKALCEDSRKLGLEEHGDKAQNVERGENDNERQYLPYGAVPVAGLGKCADDLDDPLREYCGYR